MASQALATPADMKRLGIIAGRLTEDSITDDALEPFTSAASSVAIGILRKRFVFPLASWEDDLRQYVVQLATYRFWQATGYKVTEGQKDTIRLDHTDALAALKDVANRRRDLDGVVDATPELDEGGAVVASDPLLIEGGTVGGLGSGYDILAGVWVSG